MFKKKECVAMLLAGGQGSRLYALTTKTAKPAVPFGGKYRIIDFTLSNCINSGIFSIYCKECIHRFWRYQCNSCIMPNSCFAIIIILFYQ